ncbi:MAG: hypothetical protein GX793_10665 [Bacteroidales bacterium]|jgi:NADH/NAD ratio-sensing transcriptional regulator Rex|nr:hypothetical protein [Bacteroidales bacterium]MCK9498178.1 hypothetical protein [Bacteroidales bacterium]MDY0313497.1 winged-helix domain-containing protein [Bacteroidales bacterium]NLB87509.1 hypothetical protein [Bacteroidales bacterium]
MNLSEKTVERLLLCRRELLKYRFIDKPHIFSNDLARILNIKPEQLRQDFLTAGVSAGSNRNGYDVNLLIEEIEEKVALKQMKKVAFIGDASLVDVYKNFIDSGLIEFQITAIFSFNPENKSLHNIPCFTFDKMTEIIPKLNIEIVIVAACAELVKDIVDSLSLCNIKGIINLSSENILPGKEMVVENFDLLSAIEKVNFRLNFNEELKKFKSKAKKL